MLRQTWQNFLTTNILLMYTWNSYQIWLDPQLQFRTVKCIDAVHCRVSLHWKSTVLHMATKSIIYKQLASQVTLVLLPLPVSLAAFISLFQHISLTSVFHLFYSNPLLPLSSRAGMFVTKFFEGCVPVMELQQEDKKLLALVGWELQQYIQLMDKVK